MITYAKLKGLPNIDWEYFLNHPPQTADGWKLAEIAAYGNTQNPGGCLDAAIPREKNGEIKDDLTRYTCINFAIAIKHKNIVWAKTLLKEIKQRGNELLTPVTQ